MIEKNMSDSGSLIPISDAQAELGKEAIGALRSLGSYVADIAGDLPKDVVGWLVGDRMKVRRAERLAKLVADADTRLKAQGILDPEPPSLKIAIPILEAAADEDREELRDIWARLLAAAMNPTRSRSVRQRFVTAVRSLDADDAVVLAHMGRIAELRAEMLAAEAHVLGLSVDQVLLSLENLVRAGLVHERPEGFWGLSSGGREFLRAVWG